jgi:hypothetical protein
LYVHLQRVHFFHTKFFLNFAFEKSLLSAVASALAIMMYLGVLGQVTDYYF